MQKAVIFVDVDGPMIPVRAMYLPTQTSISSAFDPCAASMLLKLVDQTNASIVISSVRRKDGYERCVELFESNGIPSSLFHEDWRTSPESGRTRSAEIADWLQRHPEVEQWVALDDEVLDRTLVPNAIQCDTYEGFSWVNFCDSSVILSPDVNTWDMHPVSQFLQLKRLSQLMSMFGVTDELQQQVLNQIKEREQDESN